MSIYKNTIKLWGPRVLYTLLFILLTLLIYHKVFKNNDWQAQAKTALYAATDKNSLWLLLIISLTITNWAIEAIRWKVLLSHIQKISFFTSLKAIFSGMSLAIVTPNKLGDFAGRIIYLPPNKKVAGALSTLIGGFAQTTIAFIFGCIGLIYFHLHYPQQWTFIFLIIGILTLSFILWSYFNFSKWSLKLRKNKKFRIMKILAWTLSRYNKKQLLKVLGLSAFKFACYNFQFAIIIYILGIPIIPSQAIFLIPLMFWLITLIPSFFLADIGVRSFISHLIFIESGFVENDLAVIGASICIWVLNLIIPALIGLSLIGIKLLQMSRKKDKKASTVQ